MKRLMTASMVAVIAVFLIGNAPVPCYGQCILNCPAGDGGIIGPGSGNKSPDVNGDAIVNLIDLATFAAAWPPNPYNFCVDYNCDGLIGLVDLANFAAHWGHFGPKPGFCQPGVDHYKTYEASPGPAINGPIRLDDQFGSMVVDFMQMTKVATPVEKNGEPMLDPIAHQTWWEFFWPEPIRMLIARDQFGEHDWMTGDARFLLNPALKFPEPNQELPILNHYKCYEAQGPVINIPVRLVDQFDDVPVFVLEGKYFCNPVKKTTPDGMTYDIVDPWAHLTCYVVDNPTPYQIQVRVRDQFVDVPINLFENVCLCLPALKLEVFEQESSEWQRIKALYE